MKSCPVELACIFPGYERNDGHIMVPNDIGGSSIVASLKGKIVIKAVHITMLSHTWKSKNAYFCPTPNSI